jgi:hypothetical protein
MNIKLIELIKIYKSYFGYFFIPHSDSIIFHKTYKSLL